MITVDEALAHMKKLSVDYGTENLPLEESCGRVLMEAIYADRDFPPFDRATKDGIAIHYAAFADGARQFPVQAIQAAGEPQKELSEEAGCLEVMTGAIVPAGADTVVPYEEVEIKDGLASLKTEKLRERQNIHLQASDAEKGTLLLQAPGIIHPGHINTLATVGKATVRVARLPTVAVISTGNELVGLEEVPAVHQIRRSNVFALKSLLCEDKIHGAAFHLKDEQEAIRRKLEELLETYDVLLLSGGVSKGKYDYVPDALQELGVEKVFHGIKQRPGKPFWFGRRGAKRVFAFPGNPVSTFACYLLYFREWLRHSIHQPIQQVQIKNEGREGLPEFWHHRLVKGKWQHERSRLQLEEVAISGSGDLVGLNRANGLLSIPPQSSGEQAFFTPFSSAFHHFLGVGE